MALTPAQRDIIQKILKKGRKLGATHKEKIAAIETAIVESGISNPKGGDADSAGWRQERQSIYGAEHARSIKKSAEDFFKETASAGHGKGQSAGSLAQSVQRSAFPERYDQVHGQAKDILHSLKGKGGGGGHGGKGGGKPVKIVKKTVHTKGGGGKHKLKTAELFYDPGINIKDGQKTSPVGGHGDHVHFASANPKSMLHAIKVAEKHGGSIGENPAFGGVAPVHVTGSYHYRSEKVPHRLKKLEHKVHGSGHKLGQAVDITGSSSTLKKIDKALAKQTFEGYGGGGKGGTKTVYVVKSGPHKGERVSKQQAQKISQGVPITGGPQIQTSGGISQGSDAASAQLAALQKSAKEQAKLDKINLVRAGAAAKIADYRASIRSLTPPAPKTTRIKTVAAKPIQGL